MSESHSRNPAALRVVAMGLAPRQEGLGTDRDRSGGRQAPKRGRTSDPRETESSSAFARSWNSVAASSSSLLSAAESPSPKLEYDASDETVAYDANVAIRF